MYKNLYINIKDNKAMYFCLTWENQYLYPIQRYYLRIRKQNPSIFLWKNNKLQKIKCLAITLTLISVTNNKLKYKYRDLGSCIRKGFF